MSAVPPYNPLKKFNRKDLRDELEFLMAEQLNGVVRGDIDSEQARAAFFGHLRGRFRKRAELKHRKHFQRRLLIVVLGGLPEPRQDDLELAIDYLRRRVLKGSLSLAEAKERMAKAVRLLEPTDRQRWSGLLEAGLLGRDGAR